MMIESSQTPGNTLENKMADTYSEQELSKERFLTENVEAELSDVSDIDQAETNKKMNVVSEMYMTSTATREEGK